MRPKSIILLALALGCGLVASIGISQVMDRRGSKPAVLETEAIYVAKADINLGELITTELVGLDEWPKSKLPMGAVTNLDDLLERRPRTKIYQGEPIVEVKLRAKNAADDPSNQIPKGYRVVPVSVKKDEGGASLIGPGDRVDVQIYVKRKGLITQTMVKTILTNIRVFAVNKQFRIGASEDEKRQTASVVSLLVTPGQASKLTLATKTGQIKMIIRNPDDDSTETDQGTTIAELLGLDAGDREKERESPKRTKPKESPDWLALLKGAATSQPPPWRVEVLEGARRTEVLFDENGKLIQGARKPLPVIPAVASPSNREAAKDIAAGETDETSRESDERGDESLTEDDFILPGDDQEND